MPIGKRDGNEPERNGRHWVNKPRTYPAFVDWREDAEDVFDGANGSVRSR